MNPDVALELGRTTFWSVVFRTYTIGDDETHVGVFHRIGMAIDGIGFVLVNTIEVVADLGGIGREVFVSVLGHSI